MSFDVLLDISERNQLWSSVLVLGIDGLTGLLLDRLYVLADLLVLNLGG